MQKNKYLVVLACIGLLLIIGLISWSLNKRFSDSLIVYCSHDSVYSEQILRKFSHRTGIEVIPKFDTEATKSLGLVELLLREKHNPRCDVFWNNELLGTLLLKENGLLIPYQGPVHKRIPDTMKDADGYWVGFGARLRVFIINNQHILESEKTLPDTLDVNPRYAALAKPLYGTTLTHFCVLWDYWGEDRLRSWFSTIRQKGLHIVNGNAAVKNVVSMGTCYYGVTDTDDYFSAKDSGQPVSCIPFRLNSGQTICIPNTVSIINGCDNLQKAQKLVDFLISEEIELELARSSARQIPLGDTDPQDLPEDVRELQEWSRNAYPLKRLSTIYPQCIRWLKTEYRDI